MKYYATLILLAILLLGPLTDVAPTSAHALSASFQTQGAEFIDAISPDGAEFID
jgi:hypothetical protein